MKDRCTVRVFANLLAWALVLPILASDAADRDFAGVLMLQGDQVLASENAERLFVPGSVQKLVVAVAALHLLGPESRVETEILAGAPLIDGTVSGDLILRGAGDPTWNERFFENGGAAEPLGRLVQQLKERGVSRVTGDLVVDTSRFPGRPQPVSRPIGELAFGYGAPVSAIAVGENRLEVEMRPGDKLGEPARFSQPGGIAWENHTRTVSEERHERGTVDLLPVWGSSTIIVQGEYPISEPAYRIEVSVPDPEERAARRLLLLLGESGIQLEGSIRVTADGGVASGKPLARITSPLLADLLPPILTDSENWYAEMLLRIVAAEVTGEGRLDSALDLLETFLLKDVGVAEGSFHLDDASGLSPYNLLAPETVVAVLRFAWSQPWRGHLLAAMARPGQGTLKAWPGLPPVHAKSGSIRHTVALAGYLPLGDSDPVFFALFTNHRPDDGPAARSEIAARLRRIR